MSGRQTFPYRIISGLLKINGQICLLRPGAGLGITREEADLGGIWLPGGVGPAGAFPRRWEALRHFGVRALVFGPTPISQSSLVAGVTESIAGSPSSPTEGLKIGRVSR